MCDTLEYIFDKYPMAAHIGDEFSMDMSVCRWQREDMLVLEKR